MKNTRQRRAQTPEDSLGAPQSEAPDHGQVAHPMRELMFARMTKSRAAARQAGKNAPLSEFDWRILEVLTRDPFASHRAIAEALNVPIAEVGARLRALDRRNVSHVLAVLDLKASGQTFCFITLEVRGRAVDDVLTELMPIREILMISTLVGGPHDVLLIVRFHDLRRLNEILFGSICQIRGVRGTSVSVVLDVPIFHPQYVAFTPDFLPTDLDAIVRDLELDYEEGVLDLLDRRIIAELQHNARQSINSISRKYGINASTIRYRINNLEARELMRFITVLDPSAVGLDHFALLEIQVEASRTQAVVATLREKAWLPQLFLCAGPAALMGIILTDSLDQIRRLKSEELGQVEGILSVNVSTLTKTHKMDFRWGQRFAN